MLEGFSQHTAFAGDGNDAVVDRRADTLGNLHLQARVNRLHLEMFLTNVFKTKSSIWKLNWDSDVIKNTRRAQGGVGAM